MQSDSITCSFSQFKITYQTSSTYMYPRRLPNFPDLGTRGKVAKWYHKEGAVIRQGDILCDIETEVRSLGKFEFPFLTML